METTTIASAVVSGGTDGKTYYVRGLVTTTTGQVLEGLFEVAIDDGPGIS